MEKSRRTYLRETVIDSSKGEGNSSIRKENVQTFPDVPDMNRSYIRRISVQAFLVSLTSRK